MALWNSLLRLASARPVQLDLRAQRVLIVIQPDIVGLTGRERNRAAVLERRVIGPIVDELLAVHPETHPVIRGRIKGIGLAVKWHDLSGPTHREGIRPDAGCRNGLIPTEVNRRVDTSQAQVGEVDIVEILSL